MTQLIDRIPPAYKAMLVIAAVFGVGMTAGSAASLARGLPARVAQLEREYDRLELAMAYLVCRAMEEDAGRDPRACRTRIRTLTDYLEELR